MMNRGALRRPFYRIDLMAWAEHVDAPVLVRGASRGFTLFVLGGLAEPLVADLVPSIGRYCLIAVAVLAFVSASARIGEAEWPILHGAIASLSAYLLVLPLVILGGGLHGGQVALTVCTGIVIGGLRGFASTIMRSRKARR